MVIALYDGAYGPTLRIDVQSYAMLELLHADFLALARKERSQMDLVDGPSFELSGLRLLRLAVASGTSTSGKCLRRIEAAGAVEFDWTLDSTEWEIRAEQIEALLRHGVAGHQYLTAEGVDDALVEFAFLEGPRAK